MSEVDHPKHYNAHPSGVECITVTEHMGFNVGNAVKYLWRAGLKSEDPVQDLEKARWYVDREIQRLKAAQPELPLKSHGVRYAGIPCPDCGAPQGLDHKPGCAALRVSRAGDNIDRTLLGRCPECGSFDQAGHYSGCSRDVSSAMR